MACHASGCGRSKCARSKRFGRPSGGGWQPALETKSPPPNSFGNPDRNIEHKQVPDELIVWALQRRCVAFAARRAALIDNRERREGETTMALRDLIPWNNGSRNMA